MSDSPLVTIIIGNYNNEKKIKRAIDSVMSQTYQNFELYITDDGSTDGSADVIRSAADYYHDDRIHLVLKDTNTAFQVLEDAYMVGKGKYISGLGGDDFFYPDKISKQVEYLETHEGYSACFTYVDADTYTGEQKRACEDMFNHSDINSMSSYETFRRLLNGNCLSAVSFMMRYDIFRSCGGYDFDYRQLQDYRNYLYAVQKGNFYVIPEKLTGYTFYSDNNISLPSPAVNARTFNESEDVIYHIFKDMSADFFNSAFVPSEGMAKTDGQLILQKIFWLIGSQCAYMIQAGHRLFFEYGYRKDVKSSLMNDYHMTRKDLFTSTGDSTIYRLYLDTYSENRSISLLYSQKRFDESNINKKDEILVEELCDLIDGSSENKWDKVSLDHMIALFDICKRLPEGKNMFVQMVEAIANETRR